MVKGMVLETDPGLYPGSVTELLCEILKFLVCEVEIIISFMGQIMG